MAHISQFLLDALHASPEGPIPEVLNKAFHNVDDALSRMCEESDGKIHSGCTAVTAFLRVEDDKGHQTFLSAPASPTSDSPVSGHSVDNSIDGEVPATSSLEASVESIKSKDDADKSTPKKKVKKEKSSNSSRIKRALRSLGGGSSKLIASSPSGSSSPSTKSTGETLTLITPPPNSRHVLYSANAGDARGVLCRAGKAVRLTYDHKGSDKQEAKRITDAGGFVMSGRVNGVLAVTRSLGDSSMKEFVVGAPYTTETELCEEDELLIMACDGVGAFSLLFTPY